MDDDFRRAFRGISSSDSRRQRRPKALSDLPLFAGSRMRLVVSIALACLALVALAAAIFASGTRSAGSASRETPGSSGTGGTGGTGFDSGSPQGEAEGTEPSTRPELDDLGGGRYRGPYGTVVKVPPGWEITKGNKIELWAMLVPAGSSAPIPRVGIGNIAAEGLDPQQALETVGYYLSEVLPEITSTEEPFRGGVLVKGRGTVEGTPLEEIRWMHPSGDGVLVVWGLFPPGYPGTVALVAEAVELPPPRSP